MHITKCFSFSFPPILTTNVGVLYMFAAELLGLPLIPSFSQASGEQMLHGVNYASAAAGILDATGGNFVCTMFFCIQCGTMFCMHTLIYLFLDMYYWIWCVCQLYYHLFFFFFWERIILPSWTSILYFAQFLNHIIMPTYMWYCHCTNKCINFRSHGKLTVPYYVYGSH